MYEDLYAPLPDTEKYLRRIGLEPDCIKADYDSLCRILRGHLAHIPFENIDAYDEGKTPELGVPALFDKMINRRRGGWCFELNGLLGALLQALGYETYFVGVRVTVGGNEMALVLHRGIIAVLPEGKFYCDVGFGTLAFSKPIPLSGDEIPGGYFIMADAGQYRVCQRKDEGADYLLRFEDRAYLPQDYVVANFFTSQNTATPFRKRRSISIQIDDLRRQLVDNTMKEYVNGELVRKVTAEDAAELKALVKECFDIEYDFESFKEV